MTNAKVFFDSNSLSDQAYTVTTGHQHIGRIQRDVPEQKPKDTELLEPLRQAVLSIGGEKHLKELLLIFGEHLNASEIGDLWQINRSNVPARLQTLLYDLRIEFLATRLLHCLESGGTHFVDAFVHGRNLTPGRRGFLVPLASHGIDCLCNQWCGL